MNMLTPDASGWYSSLYADDGFGNLLSLSVDSSMTRNLFRWDTWYRLFLGYDPYGKFK